MRNIRRLWPFRDPHERERLSALLDDELDDDEALEVTRHVAACEECFEEFEAIRQARGLLRSLPRVEPPDAFYEDVLARAPLVADSSSIGWRPVATGLVVSLLVAVTAFVAGQEESGTVAPPVEVFLVDHAARVDDGSMPRPVDLGR